VCRLVRDLFEMRKLVSRVQWVVVWVNFSPNSMIKVDSFVPDKICDAGLSYFTRTSFREKADYNSVCR